MDVAFWVVAGAGGAATGVEVRGCCRGPAALSGGRKAQVVPTNGEIEFVGGARARTGTLFGCRRFASKFTAGQGRDQLLEAPMAVVVFVREPKTVAETRNA